MRLRAAELIENEVVVLGAGPAGCAAAILLARRSHKVTLVRPPAPPAATLAESIPPSARRVLDEIGALESLEAAGLHANRGNAVWWADHEPRHEVFPDDQAGFHTDRGTLETILALAAERAGVRVLEGYSARAAVEDPGGWTVQCEGESRTIELTAPWVIDATGRHGLLARTEGRMPDRSTTTLAVVQRWRRDGGWPEDEAHLTMIESYPDGWAWSVPLAEDLRCFTAMIDQRAADVSKGDLDGLLDRELAKTKKVGATREGAVPDGPAWACPASLYTADRFGRPGLLLAGDAGSFIDPLSSFGVKKALSSGWLAGIVAHTALVDPELTATAVDFFDAREREVYQNYRRVSAEFFDDAARTHGTAYWKERAAAARTAGGLGQPQSHPDNVDPDRLERVVPEGDVRAAFDDIRAREVFAAVPGATLRTFERPGIDGYRIVLQDHLGTATYPEGMRYVRGVDLRHLVEVAPSHAEVPDGWAAYNGVAPPVTLPDYLTALATAFAAGILEHQGA